MWQKEMKKNIYKTHRREFLGNRTKCNTASYWQTHLSFWRCAGVFSGLQRQDIGALPCYFLSVVASFLDAKLGYSHTVYTVVLSGSKGCVWGIFILSTPLDWVAQRGVFGRWSYCLHCWIEWLRGVCLGVCVTNLSILLGWMALRGVFGGWLYCLHCCVE